MVKSAVQPSFRETHNANRSHSLLFVSKVIGHTPSDVTYEHHLKSILDRELSVDLGYKKQAADHSH